MLFIIIPNAIISVMMNLITCTITRLVYFKKVSVDLTLMHSVYRRWQNYFQEVAKEFKFERQLIQDEFIDNKSVRVA